MIFYSLGIAVAVGLVGLVLFLVMKSPKAQEVGRIAFVCGLLVALLRAGVGAFVDHDSTWHRYSVVVPLVVGIVGLTLYLAAKHAKAMELGRLMLFCGVLVTLIRAGIAAFVVT